MLGYRTRFVRFAMEQLAGPLQARLWIGVHLGNPHSRRLRRFASRMSVRVTLQIGLV
jgi:hypothetical protein